MPLTTDQLYTGQQYNSLSGLYHYSDGKSAGRFYDPLLACFIQPDSVTPGRGSQPLNRYAYSLNNPAKYIDPSGHAAALDDRSGEDYRSPEEVLTDDTAYNVYEQAKWVGIYTTAHPDYDSAKDPYLEGNLGRQSQIKLMQWEWEQQRKVDAGATVTASSVLNDLTMGLAVGFAFGMAHGGGFENIGGEKAIVIGETMTRVEAAAKEVGAKTYQPRDPVEKIGETKALERNERWIRDKMRKGYTIYDIGIDANRSNRSIFYEMETRVTQNYSLRIPLGGHE